jgi:hypothetical protein
MRVSIQDRNGAARASSSIQPFNLAQNPIIRPPPCSRHASHAPDGEMAAFLGRYPFQRDSFGKAG